MNRTLNRQWWSSSKSTKVIESTLLKELDVRQEADDGNSVTRINIYDFINITREGGPNGHI